MRQGHTIATLLFKIFIIILLFLPIPGFAADYLTDNFDDYTDTTNLGETWNIGSAVTLETAGCRSGKCVSVDYTTTGTDPHLLNIDPNPNGTFDEGYIKFYTKFTKSGTARIKHCKLSGEAGVSYSNITFEWSARTGEAGGQWEQVFSGGASGGDNTCTWHYGGGGSFQCGATYDTTTSGMNIVGDTWYRFEVYVKLNDTGVANGEFKVWIDGILKLNVSDIEMRDGNCPKNYALLRFGDSGYDLEDAIKVWYDDLVVASTTTIKGITIN